MPNNMGYSIYNIFNKSWPLRVQVWIGLQHPIACRKRQLNGLVLQMRPRNKMPSVTACVTRWRSFPAERPWASNIGLNLTALRWYWWYLHMYTWKILELEKKQWMNESINEWMNQSINQSINQSLCCMCVSFENMTSGSDISILSVWWLSKYFYHSDKTYKLSFIMFGYFKTPCHHHYPNFVLFTLIYIVSLCSKMWPIVHFLYRIPDELLM
jgi:hypothetical protein